jgi:hypothetical protein
MVRSTGSDVVDRVRSGLSYNDIVVSKDTVLYKKQSADQKMKYLQRVFSLATMDVWMAAIQDIPTGDVCISIRPVYDSEKKRYVSTKIMTGDFFVPGTKCLRLASVRGKLDCKFYTDEGLKQDAEFVLANATSLKLPGTKKSLSWQINRYKVLDPEQETSNSYGKVVYTLWTRLLLALLEKQDVSTSWIKPRPLDFYSHNKEDWLDKYHVSVH